MFRSHSFLSALLLVLLLTSSAYSADTYSFVTQTTNASTLSFINASTGTQISGHALGITATAGATYAADGSIAFVAHGNALVAYSVPAGKHLGTVIVPNGRFGMATPIPGTVNLFVSVKLNHGFGIFEVNGTTFLATEVFATGAAAALAVSPNGETLYLSTGHDLLSISTATFQQTASIAIAGIDNIQVTPDGSLVLLGIDNQPDITIAEYDPKSMTVVATMPAGEVEYLAISPDGSVFYTTVTTEIPTQVVMLEQVSIATLTVLKSVAIPSALVPAVGYPFAISPDGSKLVILGQDLDLETALFSLPSLTPGPVTPVGDACGVAFPSATLVSVTNCGFDAIDIVDLTTGAVKAEYDAGPSPENILTNPSGTVLYVSNQYGVWAISVHTGTILSKLEFPGFNGDSSYNGQLALSADGTILFAQYGTGVLEIATSNNQSLGNVPGVPIGFSVSAIATSPDGKYLFVAGRPADNFDVPDLLLLNQSNGALVNTVPSYSLGAYLVSSKDSKDLFYEDSLDNISYTLYDFNIASQTFTIIPSQVYGPMVLSPDGKTLYLGSFSIGVINTATLAASTIPTPVPAAGIAITPSGSTLIVTSAAPELGVITIANPLVGKTIPVSGGTHGISIR